MFTDSIFDTHGLPRRDVSESEIALMSKPQQNAFFVLAETYVASEDGERDFIDAQKTKRRTASALKKLMDDHEKIIPARTFYDEWKKVVAHLPEPEPDPAIADRIAASLKAVEAAYKCLAQCEIAETKAMQVRKEKRQAFVKALKEWSAVDGRPKSVGDLLKARAEIEAQQKLANIAAGLPPDYVEQRQSTVGPSHLDHFKANTGGKDQVHANSANHGYHRNSMRGAAVRLR
jgi:hypothetical protein